MCLPYKLAVYCTPNSAPFVGSEGAYNSTAFTSGFRLLLKRTFDKAGLSKKTPRGMPRWDGHAKLLLGLLRYIHPPVILTEGLEYFRKSGLPE